jgi:hypothetical protein
VLVLFFEEIKSNSDVVLSCVAEFLEIDKSGFSEDAPETANRGFIPRFPALTRAVYATDIFLRKRNLDFIVENAKALGARKLIESLGRKPDPISQHDRAYLSDLFNPDIEALETLLDAEITHWRT